MIQMTCSREIIEEKIETFQLAESEGDIDVFAKMADVTWTDWNGKCGVH
jgi:N-acetylglutamate synthase-like GNAT family acetyltransferase